MERDRCWEGQPGSPEWGPPCPQADRSGARHLLAEAQVKGSEVKPRVHTFRGRSPPYQLQGQGHLVLVEAQVKDERDYVCVVTAGAAGTAEATSKLQVFGECLWAPRRGRVWGRGEPGKGFLTVTFPHSKARDHRGLPQ